MPVIDGTIVSNADCLTRLGVSALNALNVALLDQLIPRIERAVQDFVGYDVAQSTYTEYLPDDDLVLPNDQLVEGYEGSTRGAVPILRSGLGPLPLMTSRIPVRSVTSLYENLAAQDTAGGSWVAGDLLTEGANFFVDWDESGICWSGKLFRQHGSWPWSRRTVKITYVHGFSSSELLTNTRWGTAFREACFDTLLQAWTQMKMFQARVATTGQGVGPIVSERFEDWAVTYSEALLKQVGSFAISLPKSAKTQLRPYVRMSKMIR